MREGANSGARSSAVSRRARWAVIGAVVAGAIGIGGSAGWAAASTILNPTSQPLPGSMFQGGDGDQANATSAGRIDWQGLEANGRVAHVIDPNSKDDVFSGGDKEDKPDGWGLTTSNGGSTPAAGNILDTYRAVDRPLGEDVFLYLAFTRAAANGTAFVTFELNQDPRLWTNSTRARIPCRKTGDILITFGPHGNQTEIVVERWVTDTKASNGCAKTGHLVVDDKLTTDDVQASFNNGSSPIVNDLPGAYGATIDTGLFGEAAINLSSVAQQSGDRCVAFGSTWMHSRSSSSSDSAALKDYVSPGRFKVRTCEASPAIRSSASGNVKRQARGTHRQRRHRTLRSSPSIFDTAILSGGSKPSGTITFRLFGPNDSRCSGSPASESSAIVNGDGAYRSGSFAPGAAGVYRWVVEYSGDTNNDSAGPTACGSDTETVVIDRATPTLASTASANARPRSVRGRPSQGAVRRVRGATASQDIYDTADLEGARSPNGTLTFELFGPDDATCSGGAIFRSVVPVQGNGLHNSAPYTPTAAGTYRWTVRYSGDANNKPAGATDCGIDAETVVISAAKPAIVTAASPEVSVGHLISDSAALSDGSRPTGKIEFKLYAPSDRNCSRTPAGTSSVDVSGNGTYDSRPFIPKRVGKYRWIATYSGDQDNESATTACGDAGEQVLVLPKPQPRLLALTTTASPAVPSGSPVHDTAVLSGTDPTGSITFRAYGPDASNCRSNPVAVSNVAVHGNGSYDSDEFTPAAVGTYQWVASYSGDEANGPARTACNDAGESVSVSRADPAIRTFALRKRPLGLAVRDLARLSGASNPHGLIIFRLYGPDDTNCSRPPAFRAVQRVIGKRVNVSPKVTPQRAGTYRWTATYTGDRHNNRAATACGESGETAVVLPRRPALATSASPPAYLHRKAVRVLGAGRSIYDAATLRGGLAPTGAITFALYGPGDTTCSRAPVFETATSVAGNGIYNSAAFDPVLSGTYRWVATYSGDANNRGAGPTSCGDSAEQVRVTIPADPILTTSASQAVTLGGAIHDTAHLSHGARPTGTITFRMYSPGATACRGTPVFTSTVTVSGNDDYDSKSFVPAKPGAYRWVAVYSGDSRNHRAGPTACDEPAETAVVRPSKIVPIAPTLSTTASPATGVGAPLTDVAHLRGGVAPFGAITFSLYGPDDTTCSAPPAFTSTVAVNGNGDYASAQFTPPLPGTYRWVATYSGDALNTGAGPTACGDPAETATASASPGPTPEHGPNVPAPPKAKPKHTLKPPPRPPLPVVTG
jgi:hypothetical protein